MKNSHKIAADKPRPASAEDVPRQSNMLTLFFEHFLQLVKVGCLFLLVSLPIVTIFAAWTGLCRYVFLLAEGQPLVGFSEFWKGFKARWKESTFCGILMSSLSLIVICSGELYKQMLVQTPVLSAVSRIVLFLFLLGITFTFVYLFPLLSVSDLKAKVALWDSIWVSLLALPRTLMTVATIWIILYLLRILFPNSIPAIIVLPEILAFLCIGGVRTPLKKYVIKKGDNHESHC